jgi:hypothetical protein
MPRVTDRRRALLTAALGFLQLPPQTSALRALHAWRDNWRGVGLIVEAMRRQGYCVSLREIDASVASIRTRDGERCRFRVGVNAEADRAARGMGRDEAHVSEPAA